jgi:hypothetical protein
MRTIHKQATGNPLDHKALSKALDVVLKAQAMGLVEEKSDVFSLDFNSVTHMLKQIAEQGIGRALVRDLEEWRHLDAADITDRLARLDQVLEESARPETEWPVVRRYLSDQLLVNTLAVSEISIRRYASGERPTPAAVAQRLHFLALVIGDLSGSYDHMGISQWFTRPRKNVFAGKTPFDLLSGEWQPEDDGPARVRQFSKSLNFCLGT